MRPLIVQWVKQNAAHDTSNIPVRDVERVLKLTDLETTRQEVQW